jgi:hypothetical protein
MTRARACVCVCVCVCDGAQFAFLRPQHSLHGVYLRLVESYAHVGLPPGNNVDTLDKLADESVQVRLVAPVKCVSGGGRASHAVETGARSVGVRE